MTEILSIDGSRIDQVQNDITKLIPCLSRSSKKSKNDERLIKQITEIRNRIGDIVLQARLKKSLAVKN
ncbi:MAG: hypothetical protein WCF01_10235 [Nitrososphaeraceae archaeon]